MVVAQELVERFLDECTQELNDCTLDSYQPMSEIRQHLLRQQRSCLERVVEDWNNNETTNGKNSVTGDEVQKRLRELQQHQQPASSSSQQEQQPIIADKLQAMNEAARMGFCRLVLYSEVLLESAHHDRASSSRLSSSGPMKRSDIMEFCGLCQTAVRLPCVERHLSDGSPLFDNLQATTTNDNKSLTIFPQKRLEAIQRKFLCALGYDPDHGTAEIKRIFFSAGPQQESNEYSQDTVLTETFGQLVSTMSTVLTNATLHAQQQQTMLSDHEEGGVTRVVAVNLTEKIVDAASGEEIATGSTENSVPLGERMEQHQANDDAVQRENLRMAQQAATLQQEILGELLSLRDEEREAKLARAQEAAEAFARKAMEIPPGVERVAFLRSVDSDTQRLMVMHKLWQGMVESNGGKEPVIHHHQR